MAEKIDKIVLEREYIVPLRKKFINTPQYKRTPKAIKVLKQFIVKHMKVYDRDLDKVKIDRYLNEEMWQRSIRKPLAKVKVKAKKFESGIVRLELVDIPEFVRFKMEKEKKLAERTGKAEKKEEKPAEERKEGEKKAEEEKGKAVVEAGLKHAENVHKEIKHEAAVKKGIKKPLARKALQK